MGCLRQAARCGGPMRVARRLTAAQLYLEQLDSSCRCHEDLPPRSYIWNNSILHDTCFQHGPRTCSMHAVVLLCELLSSDTSNPQHKTAHPHHHCFSAQSLPITARQMTRSIPERYSKSIIPASITASPTPAPSFSSLNLHSPWTQSCSPICCPLEAVPM